jgi:hypothetical protein
MVRSYVVTFAFVTDRVINNVMLYFGIGQITDRFLISWASWAVPLLLTEVIIQGKLVFAVKPAEQLDDIDA